MVSGPAGLLRVCVCVLSVRIYAKGAVLPVRLLPVEVGPAPLTTQGTGCGAVECSFCTCPLNASARWAVTFPACPPLLEQKSVGPPFASLCQGGWLGPRDSVSRSHFLDTLAPWSPAGKSGFFIVGSGPERPCCSSRPGSGRNQSRAGLRTQSWPGGVYCLSPKGMTSLFTEHLPSRHSLS